MDLYLVCGPKSSGKSTIARRLSMALKCRLLDDNYMKFIFRDEYRVKGRSVQSIFLKCNDEKRVSHGVVYALDLNFNDADDCEKVKEICAFCKKQGWLVHMIFLDVKYKATLENEMKKLSDDDICDGEYKERTYYFFSALSSYRAIPQTDDEREYGDDYILVDASGKSVPDVISIIMEQIEENKTKRKIL